MLLKRGIFRGLLVAGALFGAVSSVSPPIPPTPDSGGLTSRASAWAPGATQREAAVERERERIKRQNDTILAVVMAAVNSRLLE